MFLFLLAASTMSIAGSAAYFSVYGLAHTFGGTFWSVVVMGSALESGKLMAASYLYRFWNSTSIILKSVLLFCVAVLMVITSVGIYGYLSAGYKAETLPAKYDADRIAYLETERQALTQRKHTIDQAVLAATPTVTSVMKGEAIDPNAIRLMRETSKARDAISKQYKGELDALAEQIAQLDEQLMQLKQKQVLSEAKTGPISYVAEIIGLRPDLATHYLLILIVCAFDPLAVALTLAFNAALKQRQESLQQASKNEDHSDPAPTPSPVDLSSPPPPASTAKNARPKAKPVKKSTKEEPAEIEKNRFLPTQTTESLTKSSPPTSRIGDKRTMEDFSGVSEIVQYYKQLQEQPVLSREDVELKERIEKYLKTQGLMIYLQ